MSALTERSRGVRTVAEVKLILEEGGKLRTFDFVEDGVTIGRTADNTITISDALSSRHHCHVRLNAGAYVVEDLKSRNGTKLNGATLTEAHPLEEGDRIEVGDSVIHFGERRSKTRKAVSQRSSKTSKRKRKAAKEGPENRLRVLEGDAKGEVFPLTTLPFVCGRKASCTLALSDNDVSNEHCMIVSDQGALHLVDLGSTNGTFLDGKRISGRAALSATAKIRLGATLTFALEGVGAEKRASKTSARDKKASARKKRPKPAAREVDEVASLDALGGDDDEVTRVGPPPSQPGYTAPSQGDLSSASAVVEEEGEFTKIEFGTGLQLEAQRISGGGGGAGVAAVLGALLLVVASVGYAAWDTFLQPAIGDPSPSENKLENWSFEDMQKGQFAGWELIADQAGLVKKRDVRHGKRALELTVAPGTRPEFHSTTSVRVEAGKAYRLGASVSLDAGTAAALRVDWKNDDGTFARSTYAIVGQLASGSPRWKEMSGVVSAPAGSTQARVAGVAIAAASAGRVRFDRITLTETEASAGQVELTGPAGLLLQFEGNAQLKISRKETQLVRELAFDVGLILRQDDALTSQGAATVHQPLGVQADDSLLALGSLPDLTEDGEALQYTFTARAGADGIRIRWLLASPRPVPIRFRVPRLANLAPLELDGNDVSSQAIPEKGLVSKGVREMSWGRGETQVSFHLSGPARATLRQPKSADGSKLAPELIFLIRPRKLANGLFELGFHVQAASLRTREAIRRLLSEGEAARLTGDFAAAAKAYRRLIKEFSHDEAALAQARRDLESLSLEADRLVTTMAWAKERAEEMPVGPLLDSAQAVATQLEKGFPGSDQLALGRRSLSEVKRVVGRATRRDEAKRVRTLLERAKRARVAGHLRITRTLYTFIVETFDPKVPGVREAKDRLAALPPEGSR